MTTSTATAIIPAVSTAAEITEYSKRHSPIKESAFYYIIFTTPSTP